MTRLVQRPNRLKSAKSQRLTLSRRDVSLWGVAGGLLMGLSACSSTPAVKKSGLQVVIEADDTINLNEQRDPSPIVLRFYELKSPTVFNQATFFELFDKDSERLGADLVSKREFEVKPQDKLDFTRETPIETKHLGVIAGFREINSAQWRDIVDIVPERDNQIVVKVTSLAVDLEFVRSVRQGII
jgi:type VI secretion system protein VasD